MQRIEALEAHVGVTPTAVATSTLPLIATSAPTPIATARPSPAPTATIPSGTRVGAATCAEIQRVWRDGSTDEFLELRRTRVIDRWLVDWEGTVGLVHAEPDFWDDDYYLFIEFATDDPMVICGAFTPFSRKEDVVPYKEGERLLVTGQVEFMDIFLATPRLYLGPGTVTVRELE